MTYLERARALHERLVAIRREVHAHPELFFQEVRTAQRIVASLRELGIEAQTGIARTGVVAYIGDGQPRVALRADMDALPILEANEVPYKSQNPGVMHACGHDAHVACLLGAAMLLHEDAQRGALRGSIKLLFQPAEETCGADGKSGGRLMVEEGALDDVDAVFGLHVASMLPSGEIYVRAGAFMAAVDTFEAEILGRGGHGAYPHQALDSIWLAAQVINAIYGIVARRMDPTKHGLISVCSIHAGTTTNVIPAAVQISGTIRSFDEATRALLHRELEHAFSLTRAWGGDYTWKLIDGYPATVNDTRMANLVRTVAREMIGADKVKEAELQMGAEDFSFMARAKPAAFFNLGAKKDDQNRPHHNPIFDIDESVLPLGAAMLAATAQRFLNSD